MKNCFIVLFKDGTIQTYAGKPEKENFHSQARLFQVPDSFQIIEICSWFGHGFKLEKVKEIADW